MASGSQSIGIDSRKNVEISSVEATVNFFPKMLIIQLALDF